MKLNYITSYSLNEIKITKCYNMKNLISLIILATFYFYCIAISSCQKEFLCEDCILTDTTTSRDTTTIKLPGKIDSTINFGYCSACMSNPTYVFNEWSFRNYKSILCGQIHSAVLDSGNNVLINGIADCLKETYFSITARFPPNTFKVDQTNITASYSNFLFYDQNNVILAVAGGENGTPLTMNAVLDTFNIATKVASFRFFGYAYTNKGGSSYIIGDSTYISDGRFSVKIE